jgi:hypothetical protein
MIEMSPFVLCSDFSSMMLCEVDHTIVSPLGTLEEIIIVSSWWCLFGGEIERVPSHPSTMVNEGIMENLECHPWPWGNP